MNILVTGGAGYIGSHTVKKLKNAGYEVVVFDNLERGHSEVCKYLGVPLIKGDLRDPAALKQLDRKQIDACMHFAAYASVGDSVNDPFSYFQNNFVGSLNLLKFLLDRGCRRLIFSSTSEVYGEAEYLPIDERHPLRPLNPYGLSKRMVEQALEWFDKSHDLKFVALRYFNAAGCCVDGDIGELHEPEVHLIPNVVLGVLGRKDFNLTCTQVDTEDGTPIRDYVHVDDLAEAHIKALKYLMKENKSEYINLGTGKGYSVLQVVEAVEKITGLKVVKGQGRPRSGEPAKKYASNQKAKKILKWEPHYGLDDMVQSTFNFLSQNMISKKKYMMNHED